MNSFTKQKDSQILKTNLQLPKGKHGVGDKLGAWDYHTPMAIYKIDNQ